MREIALWLTGERSQRSWRVVLLALTVMVSWLALTPAPQHLIDTGWDKLNHACAFAALAIAGHLGFRGARARLLLLAAALIAFGVGIEVLQSFVPGRMADWHDLLADAVGIAAGTAMGRALVRAPARASALRR